MHEVTLITGDGIGPEVSAATKQIIDATGVGIDWDIQEAGSKTYESLGDPLPPQVVESIRRTKTALKAPITTPIGSGFRSVNVRLRQELDLYACVRPVKSVKGTSARYDDVDVIIVRENTEDLYAGIEYEIGEKDTGELIDFVKKTRAKDIPADSGISIKPISKTASIRISRFAFEYALKNMRKKVTSVTKSNIMKHSDDIFMKASEEVSKKYESITYEHRLIDALCMQLVQNPLDFDVLVLPNLYGDIVSDLAAGLVGGLGLAPGANIGSEYAVFEAVHGSAPDIAGRGIANPTAMTLSAALMLEHLGEEKHAEHVRAAVYEVIADGKKVTADLNPKNPASTKQMTEEIVSKL